MAGKKGRSGRRTVNEEQKRRDILQKAWTLTEAFFNNPNISALEKQKFAVQLVVKDITQKEKIEGDFGKVIITYSAKSETIPPVVSDDK